MFGVDLRACIVPRAGKKFIISDLAQIEPRVLAWLCGDEVLLDAVRNGYGIYEAFAVSTGMWKGEKGTIKKTDPAIYALSKAQVLGLGYGCGAKKFVLVSKLMAGLDIDETRSKQIVDSYRRKNTKVVALWNQLERGFKGSQREDYMVELPSGRQQKYFGITTQKGATGKPDWRASVTLGGPKFPFWGGKLTENLVQAAARDVFGEAILRLEKAGLPVVAHIHDEVILEVDKDVSCEDVNNIMAVTPDWLSGCPIQAESQEAECYKK
jgi:DNA polymerase